MDPQLLLAGNTFIHISQTEVADVDIASQVNFASPEHGLLDVDSPLQHFITEREHFGSEVRWGRTGREELTPIAVEMNLNQITGPLMWMLDAENNVLYIYVGRDGTSSGKPLEKLQMKVLTNQRLNGDEHRLSISGNKNGVSTYASF